MLLASETDMDDSTWGNSQGFARADQRPTPFYHAGYHPRHNNANANPNNNNGPNPNPNVQEGGVAQQPQPPPQQQAQAAPLHPPLPRPLPAISFIGGPFRCPESVRASLQCAASVNMFWLVMKSVRFYGGLTEDCPLELTARYIEEAKVPLVTLAPSAGSGNGGVGAEGVPPNVVVGARWEEDARGLNAGGVAAGIGIGIGIGSRMVRSSTVLSRTVRQFELSHTIVGRQVACRYIKLVIPR